MFTLNLNDPTALTLANVAKLIGSVVPEAGKNYQIRVRRDGTVSVSLFTGSSTPRDMLFGAVRVDCG